MTKPEVVDSVKAFQGFVDHYMPGTIPLNTKIDQGTKYGHFFLMPEDNLVNLYKGTEKAIGRDGREHTVRPVKNLVMIYPKEGSALNSNPAGVVVAPWVSNAKTAAANEWIDFLREDAQQRAFMKGGFRPGTDLRVTAPISPEFGLDPTQPKKSIDPATLKPDVLHQIMVSWGAVKKPAAVAFVVDTSTSMQGTKLKQAQSGLIKVLDNMVEENNQVGLVSFSTDVNTSIPLAPLGDAKFDLPEVVNGLRAQGDTALYDAVKSGVDMVDAVPGDQTVTRAVVVLSDGQATVGKLNLNDLIDIRCKDERACTWTGMLQGRGPTNSAEEGVPKRDLIGVALKVDTVHRVQIFFVGFGDADINVGRLMAQASGGEYIGSTNQNLASVIEALGPNF